MKNIKIFIDLTRLNKPIGFMLLFWPSIWGLTLGFNRTNDITLYFFYIILFFLGSVLMRSAGCIINDIADKDFDKKTQRTKNRPIPSGKISTNLEPATHGEWFLCLSNLLIVSLYNLSKILPLKLFLQPLDDFFCWFCDNCL